MLKHAVILWIATGAVFSQTASIRLQPFEDHRVLIIHDGLHAEWQLRFPEVVAAQEGTFLTSPKTPMIWRTYAEGERGYDWQTTEEYAKFAFQQVGKRINMIIGMEISPRITVKPDRLELSLRLRNISSRTFHDVTSDGGCLQHRTERFFDDDHRLTCMLTKYGLTHLDQADRSIPVRSKYFFNPAWYEDPATKAYEFFWGRSETRPAGPWIASHASQGPGAIGIAWDKCMSLRQSSDSAHRCMHSSPYFGDMRPGDELTNRGVIFFGSTEENVIRQLQNEKLTMYTAPPEHLDD